MPLKSSLAYRKYAALLFRGNLRHLGNPDLEMRCNLGLQSSFVILNACSSYAICCTVSFESGAGASSVANQFVLYEDAVNDGAIAAPTREGFAFTG